MSLVCVAATGTLARWLSCWTHMLPSGPSVAVPPRLESGNRTMSGAVIAPAVVIRPIDAGPALPLSTNQILPSGPVAIPYGVLATGIGYFVMIPGDAPADAAN